MQCSPKHGIGSVIVAYICVSCILSIQLNSIASAASLDDWRSRSIYQVLTDRYSLANDSSEQPCNVDAGLYCGGSWKGIQNRLDYIQGMNFDAIWISPVVSQLPQTTADGEAYTAYWQQDLYALNSRFGTADDLRNLIRDIHGRGMYLMLDVVVNHFGFAGSPQEVDYAVFNPFNNASYFHTYCQIDDYVNQTNVEVCWLGDQDVPLVDLRTENTDVQAMYAEWIRDLVANYSIDGLRIDSSINVNYTFFPDFVKAAGVFATGEVMTGDESLACNWAGNIGSILNYPIYYPLVKAFADPSGSIGDLTRALGAVQSRCPDPSVLGLFSENHDVPRFANMTQDLALARNVVTFTLMGDGIPIIYQGQEQHMNGGITPYYRNRAPLWDTGYDQEAPLYGLISKLILARRHLISCSHDYASSKSEIIYQDYHTFALRKGVDGSQVLTVLTNDGSDADLWILSLKGHGFPPGTYVTEILSCDFFMVNATGILNVPMGLGEARVFIPSNLMLNSGLCGIKQGGVATATIITDVYETTVQGHTAIISPAVTTTIALTTASTSASVAATRPSSTHGSDSVSNRDRVSLGFLAAVGMFMFGLA